MGRCCRARTAGGTVSFVASTVARRWRETREAAPACREHAEVCHDPAVSDLLADSPFLRACRAQQVPHTPVWFMRQAGRALPEYRRAREGVPMLTACRRPELVTELTMQPVRRYGVDAAVLFSDIVVPLHAAGMDVELRPGVGPVVGTPIRSAADVAALPELTPADLEFVADAVRGPLTELRGVPLVGFAGAPFTLASYLVEGGPSRHFERTRALMYAEPDTWHALLGRIAALTRTFLQVQVDAGVAAVQLFDSWAGVLGVEDYRSYVLPHTRSVFDGLPADLPRVHFGVGTGELLGPMVEAGATVLGVDWRVPLDEAAKRVGAGVVLQGNLDPAVCLGPWDLVADRAKDVLARGRAAAGHVFNLGHGVLPSTDPDTLTRLVDLVHTETAS
ncbi:MAG: uroporphyrinogen decarboxylase [Streptosporangiales bacterium]|nr:uroporphyrinogen decarboxylase [Streptosporangiales bacterium]